MPLPNGRVNGTALNGRKINGVAKLAAASAAALVAAPAVAPAAGALREQQPPPPAAAQDKRRQRRQDNSNQQQRQQQQQQQQEGKRKEEAGRGPEEGPRMAREGARRVERLPYVHLCDDPPAKLQPHLFRTDRLIPHIYQAMTTEEVGAWGGGWGLWRAGQATA